MNKSRIKIAEPDINKYFDELPKKILKQNEIAVVLRDHRQEWRLTQNLTTQAFINFLKDNGRLKRLDFPFPYRKEYRYVWGNTHILEVLSTIKKQAYYSHYTAVRMHGLTEQIPKTVYINHEQPPHPQNFSLTQTRIDTAFTRSPRVSQNTIDYGDIRICLINGMHTGYLGIIEDRVIYDSDMPIKVRLTNIERTLIDIAVRPIYSGGIFEVLNAYRAAKGLVSVNKLAAVLQKLKYVYPYHQVIGFYLERAGYKATSLELLRRFPIEFDFYLAHKLGETEYVPSWRLYIPKGF